MNPNVFFRKGINRLLYEKNIIWQWLPIDAVSLIGCKRHINKDWLVGRLQQMLGTIDSLIFKDIDDETIHFILNHADSSLKHEFNVLGTKRIFEKKIDWNCDIRSGYSWPVGVFYRGLQKQVPLGVDIKSPWELSRMHHLLWLGEAYLYTGRDDYAREVVYQISDWIDENPLMRSINWTCSMDVAIRAVNWMYALLFIQSSNNFSEDFAIKVTRSLYQHAFFICQNLEKQIPYSNNHYVADIVGLLYVGELFTERVIGARWKKFAIRELIKEIKMQTLPSGVNYERSVSYHRLMLELLSYPLLMLKRLRVEIPEETNLLIKRMYEFTAKCVKPSGLVPMVGDNDDGRLLPFVPRDFRNHGYINDARSLESIIASWGIKHPYCSVAFGTQVYEDAGFAVLKNNDAQVFVSNGDYSKHPAEEALSIQTHTHNDALSFDLALDNDDIIIDPGTYVYTSNYKDRNNFRSTKKHNTVMVDDEEQNDLPLTTMFVLNRNSRRDILSLKNNVLFGKYETLKQHLIHSRSFDLKKVELVIEDTLTKKGKHSSFTYFHFAPGIEPKIQDNRVLMTTPNFQIEISIEKYDSLTIIDDTVSPSFGVLQESKTLVMSNSFNDNINYKTIIRWTRINNIK